MSIQNTACEVFDQWALMHHWLAVKSEIKEDRQQKYIWITPAGRILVVVVRDREVVRIREARD